MLRISLVCALLVLLGSAVALHAQDSPRALIVIAHPDDESGFAATIYKINKELHGSTDLFLVTNGEGGYKYSTLAEAYYGLELTDEKIGRRHLPQIRKQELQNAGRILGIRNYFFMDQKDAKYGLNEHEPLDTSWNVNWVSTRLSEVLKQGRYDYVFCLLPTEGTHGGHKAATLLALRATQRMPLTQRPVVLGASVRRAGDTAVQRFRQLYRYAETRTTTDTALFSFNRLTKLGFRKALDYRMIVNWEIAEHKSQGSMQMLMNMGDEECFWWFALNNPAKLAKTRAFFERLKVAPYVEKAY